MFVNKIYLLLWVFTCTSRGDQKESYAGRQAREGQFPFAARLYSKPTDSGVTFCTASFVTDDKLLTAGHCCYHRAFRYVVFGDPDQTDFVTSKDKTKYSIHLVKKVILHPEFEQTESKIVHDLCLLVLQDRATHHQAIQIGYEELEDKTSCTALGWGSTYGYEVQHKLYYKNAIGYRCNIRFGNSSNYPFLCLEPHAVCPGDSGGPLVCDDKVYGVASFFIGRPGNNGSKPRCEDGYVDYYTELVAEQSFIESNKFVQPDKSFRTIYASLLIIHTLLSH